MANDCKCKMKMFTIRHTNKAYATVLAMTPDDAIEALDWNPHQCAVTNAVIKKAKIIDRTDRPSCELQVHVHHTETERN